MDGTLNLEDTEDDSALGVIEDVNNLCDEFMINDGDTRRGDACRLYINVHFVMCFIFTILRHCLLSVLGGGALLFHVE